MKEKELTRQPLLGRAQVIRLSRLLHMKYRPSEIADVLGVNVDTVRRSYLLAGCPNEVDEHGHYWIVGTAFREWAEDVIAKRKRSKPEPMKENQTWCVKCNSRVKIINPEIVPNNRMTEFVRSKCPHCGTTTNKLRGLRGDS